MNGPLPLTTSLSREEVQALDNYRREHGMERSEVLRHAVLGLLRRQGHLDEFGRVPQPQPRSRPAQRLPDLPV